MDKLELKLKLEFELDNEYEWMNEYVIVAAVAVVAIVVVIVVVVACKNKMVWSFLFRQMKDFEFPFFLNIPSSCELLVFDVDISSTNC